MRTSSGLFDSSAEIGLKKADTDIMFDKLPGSGRHENISHKINLNSFIGFNGFGVQIG